MRPGACKALADGPAPGAPTAPIEFGPEAAAPPGTSQRLITAAEAEAEARKAERTNQKRRGALFSFGIKMIIDGRSPWDHGPRAQRGF